MNPSPNPIKTRYTRFYLVMLILSTIGTIVALSGLISIPAYIDRIDAEPVYAITNLISAVVILPAAVVALILLWRRHHLGIWIKLNTYGAMIVSSLILLLFTEASVIDGLVKQVSSEITNTQQLDMSILEQIAVSSYYVGLVCSIVVSIVFAILWWKAWQKETTKKDTEA